MQKYECAGTGHGKHAGLFEVDCFALELKEIHILNRLTALPSAFSGQHIPQLAHGNPDTAQIPKIRTYWTCIERAALSLAPKEAQRSERQQAWGTSLGVAATHPPKYAQMSTGSAAKKTSWKGKQCSSPGWGSAGSSLHGHRRWKGEHAMCYCKCMSTQGHPHDRCFWMATNHQPRWLFLAFFSLQITKWGNKLRKNSW